MTTPAVTPNVMQQLANGQQAQTPSAAPNSSGNIFQQLAEGTYKDPNAQPEVSPEQYASDTRQMLVSGLTGMPTPNMTEQDKTEFQQGKAAGAISVPAVAGAYIAAHAALSAGIPALVTALTKGTVSLGEWAVEHPTAAKILWHGIGAAITGTAAGAGARLAGKIIREAP